MRVYNVTCTFKICFKHTHTKRKRKKKEDMHNDREPMFHHEVDNRTCMFNKFVINKGREPLNPNLC